ncbi:MAG: serine threonine- kinase ATR-like, partial [Trebouxia sp. A1-2]
IPLGEDQPHLEILPEVIRNYGLAVQYGHQHIFQSLPRLLTLWFDFGSHIKSIANRQISTAVANIMAAMAKALPSYAWLTALPQLISRICHTNPEVNTVTNHIITHVAEAYPQQALWALAAVQKSLVMGRKQAASAIMNTLKKHCTKPYNRKLYDQFPSLCDQLIRLCNHQPPAKAKSFSAKKDFAALVRSLPLDVMMPVNTGLTLTLPTSGCTERQHQPFAEVVTIADIKDEVELLPSLQKPKKVDLIGSDGRLYRFLAKPKDDLRKDNRMMEVASILNGLFAKDPASRRRNLLIRRFAVIPLTEETGIIEWVPHTHGLRHCCQDIYIADGTYDKRTVNMTVKKIYDGFQGKRKSELLDKLLAMYPPVLHRWFLARFPEPATWHNARLGFTRTTAVWSMVGHIVGLGDRHGENILLDATTGDAVHVDFAFLFDRGLTLAIPEMVPFRLTQNLVDAFGVSGYEGAFRRACEVTLQVLRVHRDTLLSVLETLVHDPLVEWVPKNAKSGAEEQENAMARDAMATIEGRLTGTLLGVSSMPSLPLSTEGQAHRLIEEATDKNNLGQMYIWWMPWL